MPTIFSGTGAVFMNFHFDEEVGGSHFLVSGEHSDDIHRKWRSPKCRDKLCRPQKGMEVAIEVWKMDTNCVGLQVIRCRSMKLSALLAKITLKSPCSLSSPLL